MTELIGPSFARAVAAKDERAVLDLLHPDVDFRAMTPSRVWEAESPADVVAALQQWFDASDVVEGVDALDSDAFADRERVGYRLRVRNDDGLHLVEQQAYLSRSDDGRIAWLRVMCSGYRRVSG